MGVAYFIVSSQTGWGVCEVTVFKDLLRRFKERLLGQGSTWKDSRGGPIPELPDAESWESFLVSSSSRFFEFPENTWERSKIILEGRTGLKSGSLLI